LFMRFILSCEKIYLGAWNVLFFFASLYYQFFYSKFHFHRPRGKLSATVTVCSQY